MYNEINGNLIQLAKENKFNLIAHGANCQNRMRHGIALQMAKEFFCDRFPLESLARMGDINKLGNIDWGYAENNLVIVNCYTQYRYGTDQRQLDYEALTLCLRKINKKFPGHHVGLPRIGCGLAGGDWETVKKIIQQELTEVDVTIVTYKKE